MSYIEVVIPSAKEYTDVWGMGIPHAFSNKFYDVIPIHNNKRSLAEVYNEALDTTENDYLILCHDDIKIEDSNLNEKIIQAIGPDSPYSICGPAGITKAKIAHKNLWHLMAPSGKPFDGASGAVGHYTGKDDVQCFMSNFGPMPQRVTLLDGVFLALNVKEVREAGVRFDENCPSKWNFYDILFCLDANYYGLKMTTWPIWMIHKSHGLTDINDEDWNLGNEYLKIQSKTSRWKFIRNNRDK